jgi:signal transduction histidine kinase
LSLATGRTSPPRAPWALLAAAGLLALLAVWLGAGSASATSAWLLAAALLTATVAVARMSHRAAVQCSSLQQQVEQQAERLARLAAAQTRFVDGVAHELRTPLTVVLNHAELLVRCSDDAAAVRIHARHLADYTLHFSALLDGFLRLVDAPSIAAAGHHVPVHCNDLMVEAVRRSRSFADGRGVHVVLTVADAGLDPEPLEVAGAQALLEAMLESVLRFAVNASWRGARVELQVGAVGASVRFRVRHHGLTIAGSELASVFDWFGTPTTAGTPTPATGGALAIAKRIVEHHRGTIELHNHAEGGGEFVVTLPRYHGPGPPRPAADPTDRSSPSPHGPDRTSPTDHATSP